MKQARIHVIHVFSVRVWVHVVILCMMLPMTTPATAGGRTKGKSPSEKAKIVTPYIRPEQQREQQNRLKDAYGIPRSPLEEEAARRHQRTPEELVPSDRQPTLGENRRKAEEGEIRSALLEGRLQDLQVVPSDTDRNRLVIEFRSRKPLPHSQLLRRRSRSDPDASSESASLHASRDRLFSVGLPVEPLVKEAIEKSDTKMLETLDSLILGRNREQADGWISAVRIVEYSKDTETLTVRPPEPLLDFRMRVSDAGSTATRVESQLREFIRRSGNIAHEGDGLPNRVRQQMLLLDRVPVTHSRYSANRTLEQIAGALRLGGERFGDRSAVVLDGLPEPRPIVGMLQLWKMKLDILSGPGWRRIRKSLHYDVLGKNRNVLKMDEAALLGELQQGDRNTVVLIAHNAEGRIYFPDGKSIEIQKIAQLEREVAPGRAVVLITCEAGGTGGRMPSLAETLLKNRIAASVFASPRVIDAARLPRLLQDVAAKPLRDALRPYHIEQYVGLEYPRYG